MSDIIKYNNLNINNIKITELKDSDRIQSQKIAYCKYVDETGRECQLKIQGPESCYETYGIPREGTYYPDAKSRSYYKLGFCHDRRKYDNINYDQIEEFYNKLVELDTHFNTDEFRKKLFGEKNYNQYSYQPLVRHPEIDEDEVKVDKNGNPYYQPPYTKIKLELEYEEDNDNPKNIPKFTVFERVNNKRVKVDLSTFADVEKFIVWQSKVRFIISFSKLYAMKTKSGKDKKGYGIILKATCIEVQRPANAVKQNTSSDAFIDSDNEDDNNDNNTPLITRNTKSNVENNLDIDEDEEIEEIKSLSIVDDVEVDEEVVEEPKSKSKSKSKSKAKN